MTPKRYDRGVVRETLIPILWILFASVMIGTALGVAVAHATPATAGEVFARERGADICAALDKHPNVPGVIAILDSLERYGLSEYDAGIALAESVVTVCPPHTLLLKQFVAVVNQATTQVGVVA